MRAKMLNIRLDTREQKDFFTFKSYGDVRVIREKVNVGDYNIPGLEHIVTVDRKLNTNELYMNFTSDYKRFSKELEKMKEIEFCYFVCCFPYSHMEEFPKNSTIPKYRWKYLKASGAFLRKKLKEIEETYPNIKFIFCNGVDAAEEITYQILKQHSEDIDG